MSSFKKEAIKENIRIADAAIDLSVSGATIRNWIKTGLLESTARGYISKQSLEFVKDNLIGNSKLIARSNKSRKSTKSYELSKPTAITDLNSDCFDEESGQKYENSLTESYRNKEGIYYTNKNIIADMLKHIKVTKQTTFLDPCCGCGNFIMEAIEKGVEVENIYGFDTDAIAVEITKQRVFLKTGKQPQNIICADFLTTAKSLNKKFDLIYTNPPWGKKLSKNHKECFSQLYQIGKNTDTCSLFAFASIQLLSQNGSLGLLLPESVLNVARFQNLRQLFLSFSIQEIKNYGKAFKSVQSKAYSIIIEKTTPNKNHQIQCSENYIHLRLQTSFTQNPMMIFNVWTTAEEQNVIQQLFILPHYSLKNNANWGLGIVTGDNINKCKPKYEEGLVPIFRGKDISPNKLNEPTIYIDPDLSKYQQTAPISIYYAPKKIIYRFISEHLIFFCDTKQNLILNSANALVLKNNFPISEEQLVSLFNSRIINWLFKKLFRTNKILRTNLEHLPIYTSHYLNDMFDENSFLKSNNIKLNKDTYSIKE